MNPKCKMQSVKFASIEEFLDYLPEEELAMTEKLRSLVLQTMPNSLETLSYNVLFYKLRKGICFIWPSSVLWGKKKTYKGVRFGFIQGYLMEDSLQYLDKGNRKQVYYKDFATVQDIDTAILLPYLHEAILIDEALAQTVKKKKSQK